MYKVLFEMKTEKVGPQEFCISSETYNIINISNGWVSKTCYKTEAAAEAMAADLNEFIQELVTTA
jgi:hypothetical protein